jgi:hypothetical protein
MFGDVRAFQEMWGMFNVPFTGASDPVLFKDLDKLQVATPGSPSIPCLYNQLAQLPICNSKLEGEREGAKRERERERERSKSERDRVRESGEGVIEVRKEGVTPLLVLLARLPASAEPRTNIFSRSASHFPRLCHLSAFLSQPLEETFDQTVLHERIKDFSRNAVAHW